MSDETETAVQPTKQASGKPAYFSCWDIHAFYGESYIVQGVSFDIHESEIVALLGVTVRARHQPYARLHVSIIRRCIVEKYG